VKTLLDLSKIYNASVGRNANLLLNVPVDRRGLIHKNDSLRLMEFKKLIDESFKTNIALNKTVSASTTRDGSTMFAASNLSDGNFDTYWTTNDDTKNGSFTIDLGNDAEINRIVLQEYIPLGQRVALFSVEVWDGKAFREIDRQTTIGYKRILAFPSLKTSRIRINILDANACPVISEIQIFRAPELLSLPVISRDKNGNVSIVSESSDPNITYTTDGAEPTYRSKRYTGSFNFISAVTIKAKSFIDAGLQASETVTVDFDIAPLSWRIISATSEEKNFAAANAIDGNNNTLWISSRKDTTSKYPREITIDLSKKIQFRGFTYMPRQDGNTSGTIYKYSFYVSDNGKDWKQIIKDATFANIKNNPVKQNVKFDKAYSGRFIRLEALSPANDKDHWVSAAEIGVITKN
jgi:alpha-L-fucosidase